MKMMKMTKMTNTKNRLDRIEKHFKTTKDRTELQAQHRITCLDAVLEERAYQDRRWGPLDAQNKRDVAEWVQTIDRCMSKAEDADCLGKYTERAIELVQVAAVAFAALEQLAPGNIDALVRSMRKGKP